jgi:hypothetical protein
MSVEFPRIKEDVLWRRDGEEDQIILAKAGYGAVFILNPTSAYIFEKCDGRTTPEQILHLLSEESSMSMEDVRKDFYRVLKKIRRFLLIE